MCGSVTSSCSRIGVFVLDSVRHWKPVQVGQKIAKMVTLACSADKTDRDACSFLFKVCVEFSDEQQRTAIT